MVDVLSIVQIFNLGISAKKRKMLKINELSSCLVGHLLIDDFVYIAGFHVGGDFNTVGALCSFQFKSFSHHRL
jgi:hypothetical protein